MDKNKMLIDATHPEETRVVVLRHGRVEEFDFESAARKLLRGNIYLAKVTRVEPSLQAAFVEYGGNRHGFLAFSEIHPDYYQIPVADREALKQAEAEAEAAAEAEADERARRRSRGRRQRNARPEGYGDQPFTNDRDGFPADRDERGERASPLEHDRPSHRALSDVDDEPRASEDMAAEPVDVVDRDVGIESRNGEFHPRDADALYAADAEGIDRGLGNGNGEAGEAEQIEEVTTEEDALEEVPERPRRRMRQYKIQEVIKRRQVILVQVVKEERGNKGAALTTYISLAGRYTVLMPNTGRGGGISRKITQPQDRKRLKAIAEELEVPDGMGLIIRTAGAARTMQEIKRDYEYLLRLWENVRDLTLASTAPSLVYEEGNLIKRSIRDLYTKDIGEILVAGEPAFREAHQFMGMLMPGHGDDVVNYKAPEPLFNRFGIERQLNAMFNPVVTLRSGGYVVINQTEALVAIDVNSGRSTREFSIEETALNTNIEAAEEIARQLKLRDLAGLIVIDFIDMEEKRNNRTVERRLKDALRHDRARIQVGRISHFGLLEMSRQRLRTGVVEGSTSQCPHCQGTGTIRSTESIALAVLRGLEEQLMRQPSSVSVATNASVALYILNHKRPFINEMERRFGITITVEASERMHGANFAIERTSPAVESAKSVPRSAVNMEWGFDDADAENESERPRAEREPRREAYRDDQDGEEDRDGEARGEEGGRGRRRRRRRGRRGDRPEQQGAYDDTQPNDQGIEQGRGWRGDDERDEPRPHHRGARHASRDDRGGAGGFDRNGGQRFERGAPERDDRISVVETMAGERDDYADNERVGQDARPGGHGEHRDKEQNGHDSDRPRRGRRRGRRGGRARGRDEARGPEDRQPQHGRDGEGWRVVDVAHPGADQPAPESNRYGGHTSVLETDVRGTDAREGGTTQDNGSPRSSIIETVDRSDAERSRLIERPPVLETASIAQPIEPITPSAAEAPASSASEENRPTRKGWWQRRFGGD